MVVVVIVTIITVLGVPNFVIWQAKSNLKQATMELTANINFARKVAMNRNQRLIVRMVLFGNQVQAQFQNTDLTQALPSLTLPLEVTGVAGTPATSTVLTFNSLGMLVGAIGNQHINLTSNKLPVGANMFTVQVSPGGKVRWCARVAACL